MRHTLTPPAHRPCRTDSASSGPMRGSPTTVLRSRCDRRPPRGRCCAAMFGAKPPCPRQTARQSLEHNQNSDVAHSLFCVIGDENKREILRHTVVRPKACGHVVQRPNSGALFMPVERDSIQWAVGETLWRDQADLGLLVSTATTGKCCP